MGSKNPSIMKFKTIMVACVMISLLISSAKVSIAESPTYKTAKDYIVEYAELYDTDATVLLKVAECESELGKKNKGDYKNGEYLATGIFMYHKETWSRHSNLFGEKLDINSINDQAKLTAFIFSKYPNLRNEWTTYRAIKNGGTYSFYSKLLERHFVIKCK